MRQPAEQWKPKPQARPPFQGNGWLLEALARLAGEEWGAPAEDKTPYYGRLFSKAENNISMALKGNRLVLIRQADIHDLLARKFSLKINYHNLI